MPSIFSVFTTICFQCYTFIAVMKKSFKIGVLAIQGAFAEHKNAFQNCALKFSITITMVEIRSADDITADLDGIVLPGGESTAMGRLLKQNEFGERLKTYISGSMTNHRPVIWGTCGGLIMLSNDLVNQKQGGQYMLGGLDVTVSRNFFGSQINSFEGPVTLDKDIMGQETCHGVFIRAPAVTSCDSGKVQVLGCVDARDGSDKSIVVAVQQGNILATSFHPELTSDRLWQKYFLDLIVKLNNTA
ncbi:pyridoxal 5'-phosphate synthase subunit PdxT-like [Hydractinia symbiolongicarpus]|uniref:pyridoxal 5'-phosphate synthase subunit PdxT-like n=1 Tax=Hydractinia symbiolongicarpus TaxID=13093 RepID=UPI00254B1ABB|nr:pyridoxal 5'-phosphate synthase subunit PdxT-like [Hydractinia symbiolongicarpus]